MATGTLAVLRCVFGDLLNDHILNVGHIDSTTRKRHVWFPVTNSNKIVDAVYSFFKWRDISSHSWTGCQKIWKLNPVPRVKFFFNSLLCMGRSKLMNFCMFQTWVMLIYVCFCGLNSQTIEHIFSIHVTTLNGVGRKLEPNWVKICNLMMVSHQGGVLKKQKQLFCHL